MGYSLLIAAGITIAGHEVKLGGSQNLSASDLTNGTTGSGNIVLATSPTVASPTLGAATGVSLVLTGPVYAGNYVDAASFGAVGDGVTDSSSAFQNAINHLNSLGGGTLRVTGDTGLSYLLHNVSIAGNNIKLIGDRGVAFVNNSTNTFCLQIGGTATFYFNNTVENISFDQQIGVTPTTGNVGLVLNNVGQTTIRDCQFDGLNFGLFVENSSNVTIDNIWAVNCPTAGIELLTSSDIRVTNSHSDSNAVGWLITDSQGLYLTNVSFYNNDQHAFNIFKTSMGNFNFFFDNVVADTSGMDNIIISDLQTGVFSNLWASSQQSIGVNQGANGLLMAGSGTQQLVFSNFVAMNNNGSGVNIQNSGGMPTNISFTNPLWIANGVGGIFGPGFSTDNVTSTVTIMAGEISANANGALNYGGNNVLTVCHVIGTTNINC